MNDTSALYIGMQDRAGLEKLLRAWTLTANCGPGLGLNYRPAQGTIRGISKKI